MNYQSFFKLKGDLVEIYSDALTEKVYRGEIKQIAPRAEMVETADGPESKVKLKIAFREKAGGIQTWVYGKYKDSFRGKDRGPINSSNGY